MTTRNRCDGHGLRCRRRSAIAPRTTGSRCWPSPDVPGPTGCGGQSVGDPAICASVGRNLARCRQLHFGCDPGRDARAGVGPCGLAAVGPATGTDAPRARRRVGAARGPPDAPFRARWGPDSPRSRPAHQSRPAVTRPAACTRGEVRLPQLRSTPVQNSFSITIQM